MIKEIHYSFVFKKQNKDYLEVIFTDTNNCLMKIVINLVIFYFFKKFMVKIIIFL